MATRALIGYLDTEGVTRLTTTYNHYDGYPSNLGKALKNFFDSDSLARDIAEYGYISYIDPSNGDIEANNRQAPGHVTLPDNFEDAMDEIAAEIDAHGADYGYIWDNSKGEWITIENDGIGEMSQELEMELSHLKDKFDQPEQVDEAIKVDSQETFNKVLDQALYLLKDRPALTVDTWKKSLANDIRLNGIEQYNDFTSEDFVEDYYNYADDKMDLDELFAHQMKYKAGIIK
jgi:hypothetical protein